MGINDYLLELNVPTFLNKKEYKFFLNYLASAMFKLPTPIIYE